MRALLVAAVLISAAGGVCADEKAQAREHYFKGTKAFDLGAYDEAITEYSAAYRAKDDPALLYNIAQAHRLAGHPTEALRFYKIFLSKVPTASNRPEVEAKIAELQKLIEQQKRTETIPPSDVKPLTPSHDQESEPKQTAPPATVEVSPPAPETVQASKPIPSDSHPGRTKKVAGLAVGAAGLALVAAGVGLSVAAQQAGDDLTALTQSGGTFDPSTEAAGRTYSIVGPVLLGVGAAAVVAGVVVGVLGVREAKRAHSAASSARRLEIRF